MTHQPGRDTIYNTPQERVAGFAFDDKVAAVFEDMIGRSVPGYALTLSMLGVLASEHATPGSSIFDLGCSLGAGIAAIRSRIRAEGCHIIGIDNSEAMLEHCRANLAAQHSDIPVELACADIRDTAIHNASMTVLNFTLQFVPVEDRLALLTRIHDGLLPDGVLVLSEKVAFDDQKEQQFQSEMHHAFKAAQGYSALEISQKRSALENVLIPETLDTHMQRLHEAGFTRTHLWFRCFNFASIVAMR